MAASIRDIAGRCQYCHQRVCRAGRGDDGTAAGTVCFALGISAEKTETSRVLFSGDCQNVVEKAVHYSLAELVTKLSG